MEKLKKNSIRIHLSRGSIRLLPERRPTTPFCHAIIGDGAVRLQFSLGNKSFEPVVIAGLIPPSIVGLI